MEWYELGIVRREKAKLHALGVYGKDVGLTTENDFLEVHEIAFITAKDTGKRKREEKLKLQKYWKKKKSRRNKEAEESYFRFELIGLNEYFCGLKSYKLKI